MNINDNLMINLKNNLFNENSIKKYSNNFILTPQKRVKLERYIERVQNNEFKGETKGYPAFLKFLEDILDYEEDKHISFDDNVDIGSDRVEFALKDNDGKFMVIELKGQNANLDKPQNRANDKRSPVEQAFGYAQHSSKKSGLVQWILVSNYKEFRLYNYEKRLGESISFNVEDLLNDDIFKTFMFAFSKESHVDLKAINDVVTENYIEKTQLANNFYKLFNETRLMIYKELNELHGMNKKESISNAQTILDRFIFICFASSRELLPVNIARKTLMNRIKNEDIRDHEIWRDLNYLFIDIDIGNDDRNISKYNGGLFKDNLEDIKLKDIIKDTNFFKDVYQKWNFKEFEERLKKEIKPSILKRVNSIYINLLIISYFDFSEEKKEDNKHKLDIEILGHIFENSIGDIEELKEGSKGRRKIDAIFYTPEYITDYICKNTIMPYLSISGDINTVEGLLKEYSTGHEIENLDQKLKNIRIVDPACGSGAFLNKATDILLDVHKGIFEIKKGYKTSTSMRVGTGKRRRTENVQHMDIGVYVFDALSKRREILLNNIYGVDLNSESVEITKLSLFLKVCEKNKELPDLDKNIKCGNSLIDDPEYTNKPFKWDERFNDIFKDGGFDVVIGNPPYIDSEYMVKNKPKERKIIAENYETAKGNWDIYIPFYELAYKVCKKGGLISFITPNKWLSINYGKALRKKIGKQLLKVCDCSRVKVFDDADNTTVIVFIKKQSENEIVGNYYIDKDLLFKNSTDVPIDILIQIDNWGLLFSRYLDLLLKINQTLMRVSNVANVENPFSVSEAYDFIPFLFDFDHKNKDSKLKFVNTGTIKSYTTLWGIKQTSYIKKKYKYPFVLEKEFNELMPKRFKQSVTKKIIIKGIRHFKSFLDFKGEYVAGKSTIIIKDAEKNFPLELLMTFLNSEVISFYIREAYSALGIDGGINFTSPLVKKIPLREPDEKTKEKLINLSLKLSEKNFEKTREIIKFKTWLEDIFGLSSSSKKIEHYYELNTKDLIKELKKKNVNVKSMDDHQTLKNEFKESIKVINPLLQQIEETDSEIDQMVYDLYGLTNEEIKIVEDNI